jgi:ligand-binding sensor protein
MKLTDMVSLEEWITIEDEMVERTGLCAGVLDTEHVRLTDNVKWSNGLCPKIKGDPKSKAQVCSVSQAAMAQEAQRTGKPVVGECDAGFAKIVVPIFVNGEFAGTAGGCGQLFPEGEVETFLVSKVLGMPEDDVKKFPVGHVDHDTAQKAADWMHERIKEVLKA